MWSLGSSTPNFTLKAHEKGGVNYVDFYPGAEKLYLVASDDDRTIKSGTTSAQAVYRQWKDTPITCCFAVVRPSLPSIVSGSEDSTIKTWNSGTCRLENTLSYALERT